MHSWMHSYSFKMLPNFGGFRANSFFHWNSIPLFWKLKVASLTFIESECLNSLLLWSEVSNQNFKAKFNFFDGFKSNKKIFTTRLGPEWVWPKLNFNIFNYQFSRLETLQKIGKKLLVDSLQKKMNFNSWEDIPLMLFPSVFFVFMLVKKQAAYQSQTFFLLRLTYQLFLIFWWCPSQLQV